MFSDEIWPWPQPLIYPCPLSPRGGAKPRPPAGCLQSGVGVPGWGPAAVSQPLLLKPLLGEPSSLGSGIAVRGCSKKRSVSCLWPSEGTVEGAPPTSLWASGIMALHPWKGRVCVLGCLWVCSGLQVCVHVCTVCSRSGCVPVCISMCVCVRSTTKCLQPHLTTFSPVSLSHWIPWAWGQPRSGVQSQRVVFLALPCQQPTETSEGTAHGSQGGHRSSAGPGCHCCLSRQVARGACGSHLVPVSHFASDTHAFLREFRERARGCQATGGEVPPAPCPPGLWWLTHLPAEEAAVGAGHRTRLP